MTAEPLRRPLVWVDLEMSGLDPDRDVILEAAVLVTDGSLERVVEGPDLVLAAPEEALEGMVDVVAQMHAASGLTEAVRASTVRMDDAEEQLLAFVAAHVPEARTAPLAGNSVHADRAFLRRYMPAFESHLHYRNVDVSTLKELCKRWRPDVLEASAVKAGGHRAMADIRESLEELRAYRDVLFLPPGEPAAGAQGDTGPDGGTEPAGEGSRS
ncbi:MAG: oligoribonuclease [Egibacteraceae bacterium]